ncbi:hypothetical protein VNO77_00577 [Canavalia gladiata]|uniref:Secreted protein n=1 Tax=Canavalia gladiata TaxID=3824 RepID=A0AAN9R5F7_CANGL
MVVAFWHLGISIPAKVLCIERVIGQVLCSWGVYNPPLFSLHATRYLASRLSEAKVSVSDSSLSVKREEE